MRVSRNIVRQEFKGYKAIKARVFGLVNNPHATAAELFKDAIMRDSLPDQGCGVSHLAHILGCASRQVNEGEMTLSAVDSQA